MLQVLMSTLLAALKVIKGAGALQYGGNAIGGVIITSAPTVPLLDSLYGKTILSGHLKQWIVEVRCHQTLTKSYENGLVFNPSRDSEALW